MATIEYSTSEAAAPYTSSLPARRELVDALDRATTSSLPPTASSVVAEAEGVLDAVDRGEVVVVPPTVSSSSTPAPPVTTSTTVPPATSTSAPDSVIRYEPPVPSTTVPPPFTVTVP